jgi:3-deoxy-D-manno-octulosonate 8-phosphate phosphatase (KDO 8-P phosphatase)
MREVGYAIATANADSNTKKVAHFVTERMGGDRAVSEACLHLLKTFFEAYQPESPLPQTKFSGTWAGQGDRLLSK